MEDNMQLRRRQVELEQASRQMGTLEEQLGGLDVGNLEQERRSLVNQHNKLQEKVMDGSVAWFVWAGYRDF